MTEIKSAVVGTKFAGDRAVQAIQKMKVGDPVRLEREDHPKDPLAIRVYSDGVFVGFIPRVVNSTLAPAMDGGAVPEATIVSRPDVRGKFIKTEPMLVIRWD